MQLFAHKKHKMQIINFRSDISMWSLGQFQAFFYEEILYA